jgi:hypothetical protein
MSKQPGVAGKALLATIVGSLAMAILLIDARRVSAGLTQQQLSKLVKPSIQLTTRFKDQNGHDVERNKRILTEHEDRIVAFPSGVYPKKDARLFDIPWDTQLFIDSFRAYHPQEAKEKVWKDFLERGDKIVAEELTLLEGEKKDEGVVKKELLSRTKEFNLAFLAAFEDYARAKGKKASKGYGGAGEYYVEFHLIPPTPGAKVSIVGVAYLEAARAAGLADKPGIWRDIPAKDKIGLKYGDYILKASWPGGRSAEKKIRIEKNGQFDIEPEK